VTDVLGEIVAWTRREVETRKAATPCAAIERAAGDRVPQGAQFRDAVSRPGQLNVIAECKRRSPSKGVLRADYQPTAIAVAYERAGAAAVSVLTEPHFFDGSLGHLADVRAATRLPLLRKDFVIDPYQLLEARASGADAVLLVAAIVDDGELTGLISAARGLGLEALVEAHDEEELARAIGAGAAVVGVNNRDLRTLRVDVDTSARLIPRVPRGVIAVAESGIRSPQDLVRLTCSGYHACLVGEHLVTCPDPGRALAEWLHVAEDLRDHA
jgi:indole-3-glycerol phosphate synthase